ncbi:GumC family protein [Pannonibacter sp. SL95]|uniref:GumC family protein n=1 Tax=Pannonibacter sp. SL95 TaxID=2995153 RepID=UPI0022736660|nr:Wzz/FepE/Etk N-terminal domain-containing protein [Pannonibacter sp. SL95]MCY1708336.1 Wzz/FepE/Etk N-terminal domain-containing protein [Pannonibacter sp. SL95]
MDETEIDFRHLFGIVRRQIKLIAATIAVVLAIAIIAVFSITPMYSGTTLILVDPSRKNLLDPTNVSGSSATDSARVESEVEIVDSDAVLLSVIADKGLITDPEFGIKISLKNRILAALRIRELSLPTGQEALGIVLSRFKDNISVSRRGLTYLIAVSVRSENAARSAELANAIAETYIRSQIESKTSTTRESRDIIQRQLVDAEKAVVFAEKAFDDYIFGNVNAFVDATGRSDLVEMRNRIDELTTERTSAESRVAGLRQKLQSADYQTLAAELENEAVAALNKQRLDLQRALGEVAAGSARAVNLRQELAAIERNLATETETALGELQASIGDYDKQASTLRRDLNTAILGSNLPADTLAQIYRLQQMSRNAATQYQALLARSQTLETESALQIADSRVVSPAYPPTGPSSPKVMLILAVATLFAIGAGFALAFIFENFIGGFTSEEQVQAITRLPLATVVPRHSATTAQFSVSDALIESPLSMYAESIRRLRATIDNTLQANVPKPADGRGRQGFVIMMSSALPGEGKSTMSLSLARTLALSGASTLIIDCDFRKPSIQRHLNLEPSNGLVDFLVGDTGSDDLLQNIVKADPKTSLTAVIGARRSDVPTDQLITQERFARLVQTARTRFDYVVLDSPPIEPVVDGLYLAKYADVITFVIRWAKTPQRLCVHSLQRLSQTKADHCRILTLLNQQEGKSGYYTAYSDYYSE